jgi:hypothetical protein
MPYFICLYFKKLKNLVSKFFYVQVSLLWQGKYCKSRFRNNRTAGRSCFFNDNTKVKRRKTPNKTVMN